MIDLHPRAVGLFPVARGFFSSLAAVAAALLILSVPAYPHAGEFILAKFIPGKGRLTIEITIDCTGHPLIRSEAEAHQTLSKTLILISGDHSRQIGEIAPLRFERRTSIDPETPIPKDVHDTERPHQIVTAHWQSDLPPGSITLQNAPDSGQSVILWQPSSTPGEQPRWTMLVPGDTSPPIAIQPAAASRILPYALAGGTAFALALAVVLRRRRASIPAQPSSRKHSTTAETL